MSSKRSSHKLKIALFLFIIIFNVCDKKRYGIGNISELYHNELIKHLYACILLVITNYGPNALGFA